MFHQVIRAYTKYYSSIGIIVFNPVFTACCAVTLGEGRVFSSFLESKIIKPMPLWELGASLFPASGYMSNRVIPPETMLYRSKQKDTLPPSGTVTTPYRREGIMFSGSSGLTYRARSCNRGHRPNHSRNQPAFVFCGVVL